MSLRLTDAQSMRQLKPQRPTCASVTLHLSYQATSSNMLQNLNCRSSKQQSAPDYELAVQHSSSMALLSSPLGMGSAQISQGKTLPSTRG